MGGKDKASVAIVEDDDVLVFLLREICAAAGCRVIGQSAHVADALSLMEREQPDVLIFDFSLAGRRDGLELLAAVRRRWPAIVTVMLTGWERQVLAGLHDFVEPDHFLRKPVPPRILAELLAGIARDRAEAWASAA